MTGSGPLTSAGAPSSEPENLPIPPESNAVFRIRVAAQLLVLVSSMALASPQTAQMSEAARQYLDAALDLMQEHSFRRELLDWNAIRAGARTRAAGAVEAADTHAAIAWALVQLGDNHSYLDTPGPAPAAPADTGEPAPRFRRQIESRSIVRGAARFALIGVPMYVGSEADAFATRLHDAVRALQADAPCAWIVDVRGNGGGNMWPMLAGVGPVLGEGRSGGFLTLEGRVEDWYYETGVSGVIDLRTGERHERSSIQAEPLRIEPAPPVAVLIDGLAASSGEAVLIAFLGRPDTRVFGTPTYGLPTANQGFALSDGAELVITVGANVDRDGNVYTTAIAPDVRVEGGDWGQPEDPVVDAALSWLTTMPACSAS